MHLGGGGSRLTRTLSAEKVLDSAAERGKVDVLANLICREQIAPPSP